MHADSWGKHKPSPQALRVQQARNEAAKRERQQARRRAIGSRKPIAEGNDLKERREKPTEATAEPPIDEPEVRAPIDEPEVWEPMKEK